MIGLKILFYQNLTAFFWLIVKIRLQSRQSFSFYYFPTLVHGHRAKQKVELALIAVQIDLSNFGAWPYSGETDFQNF